MPVITIITGSLLILIALVGYFGGDSQHWTAFIPAFFGAPLLILGALAAKFNKAKKHLMHVAVVFSLLGALGGLGMTLPKLPMLFEDDPIARFNAFVSQLVTGVLCLAHVILAVRSFIAARRKTLPADSAK